MLFFSSLLNTTFGARGDVTQTAFNFSFFRCLLRRIAPKRAADWRIEPRETERTCFRVIAIKFVPDFNQSRQEGFSSTHRAVVQWEETLMITYRPRQRGPTRNNFSSLAPRAARRRFSRLFTSIHQPFEGFLLRLMDANREKCCSRKRWAASCLRIFFGPSLRLRQYLLPSMFGLLIFVRDREVFRSASPAKKRPQCMLCEREKKLTQILWHSRANICRFDY